MSCYNSHRCQAHYNTNLKIFGLLKLFYILNFANSILFEKKQRILFIYDIEKKNNTIYWTKMEEWRKTTMNVGIYRNQMMLECVFWKKTKLLFFILLSHIKNIWNFTLIHILLIFLLDSSLLDTQILCEPLNEDFDECILLTKIFLENFILKNKISLNFQTTDVTKSLCSFIQYDTGKKFILKNKIDLPLRHYACFPFFPRSSVWHKKKSSFSSQTEKVL